MKTILVFLVLCSTCHGTMMSIGKTQFNPGPQNYHFLTIEHVQDRLGGVRIYVKNATTFDMFRFKSSALMFDWEIGNPYALTPIQSSPFMVRKIRGVGYDYETPIGIDFEFPDLYANKITLGFRQLTQTPIEIERIIVWSYNLMIPEPPTFFLLLISLSILVLKRF